MTYRSFRRDKHLENGEHMVFLDASSKHIMYHTSRLLKNRYKINIVNTKTGTFRYSYETTYYPDKQTITIDKSNKSDDYAFLLDYYQKYINSAIDNNYLFVTIM